jgi:hypothetical protein
MVRPGENYSRVRRSIARRRRAALLYGLTGALVFAAMPSWAGEEPAAAAVPQVAVATTAEPEGSTTPPDVTVVKEPEPGAERTSDQQRRVLMLLIMNSAGPVRPFGNLGR